MNFVPSTMLGANTRRTAKTDTWDDGAVSAALRRAWTRPFPPEAPPAPMTRRRAAAASAAKNAPMRTAGARTRLLRSDIRPSFCARGPSSGRVDHPHADHAQSRHAGDEEVFAPAGLDELGQPVAEEWRLLLG